MPPRKTRTAKAAPAEPTEPATQATGTKRTRSSSNNNKSAATPASTSADNSPPVTKETKKRNTASSKPKEVGGKTVAAEAAARAKFNALVCENWYKEYKSQGEDNEEDEDEVGIDGIERLCTDLGLTPDSQLVLALAYKLGAQQMGVFTRGEWMNGMQLLDVDSNDKLKAKFSVLEQVFVNVVELKEMYKWAFGFGKEQREQKYISVDTYNHVDEFIGYLDDEEGGLGSVKVINKDQWMSFFDFCMNVRADLSNYEDNSAWPVLLDEFVEYTSTAATSSRVNSHTYSVDVPGSDDGVDYADSCIGGTLRLDAPGLALTWRVVRQRVLTLRAGECELHVALGGGGVVGAPLVANSGDGAGVVVLLVCRGALVQLALPRDPRRWALLAGAGLAGAASPPPLARAHAAVHRIKALDGRDRRATTALFPDLDTAVVGCDDGAIVVVDCRLGEYRELEFAAEEQKPLFQASFFATPLKYLPGWSTAASTPSQSQPQPELAFNPKAQPVSLASVEHNDGIFILAYCRDRNIRVYDLIGCRHIKTIAATSGNPRTPGNPNVSTIASSFSSFGIGSSTIPSSTNAANENDDDELLPDLDPTVTMCNYMRVFGVKTLPDPLGGTFCQFKVAVYSTNENQSDEVPEFIIFEGDINASGNFRQIHLLGSKRGPSQWTPSSTMKQFDVTAIQNTALSRTNLDVRGSVAIEDDDNQLEGTIDVELFQIWMVVSSSNPLASGFESVVYFGDVEIGAAEDGAGLRVRPSKNQTLSVLGDRWAHAILFPAASASKSTIPDLQFLLRTRSSESVYADFIFDCSYFSLRTITLAVEAFTESIRRENQFHDPAKDFRELCQKKSATGELLVTSQVEIQQLKSSVVTLLSKYLPSPGTNATSLVVDKKQIVTDRWVRFLQTCCELDNLERVPSGLYLNTTTEDSCPSLLIHRRGQQGTVRPCDPVEVIHFSASLFVGLDLVPEPYFARGGGSQLQCLRDTKFRGALSKYLTLVNLFKTNTPAASSSMFAKSEKRQFLDALREKFVGQPIRGSVPDNLVGPLVDKYLNSGLNAKEGANVVAAAVKTIEMDFGEFVEAVLRCFEVEGNSAAEEDSASITHALAKKGKDLDGLGKRRRRGKNGDELVDSLFVKTVQEVSEARRSVIEDLLVVVACVGKVGALEKVVSKRLITRCLGIYQSCLVLSHVAKATVIVKDWVSSAVVGGDDVMEIEGDHHTVSHLVPLSLFLRNVFGESTTKLVVPKPSTQRQQIESVESKSAFLIKDAFLIAQNLGLFQRDSSTVKGASARSPFANLMVSRALVASCKTFAAFGYSSTALELLNFYPKDTYCLNYLDGYVRLKAGDWDGAEVALKKAGEGFIGGLGRVMESDWKLLLDDAIIVGGALQYYRHVIALFEEERAHKHVAVFAKLALESIQETDTIETKKLSQDLWKTMFSHSLDAKAFESAYLFLNENTDLEMKRICIRSFVNSLCQAHKIDDLCCRYTFGNLQSEVEESLLFQAKARRVAPLDKDEPNYHQILYAYYTYHGDNRNASAIMYDYARRLNSVSSLDIGGASLVSVVTEQARAYLAAINSLSLVNVDYQWLLYKVGNERVLGQKKRRKIFPVANEPEYGTTGGVSRGSKEQEIVDVGEIRKEYILTMAKLNLAHRYHELSTSAGLPDVDIAVSLLIQEAQFDPALQLAKAYEIPLDEIFAGFGAHCAKLAEDQQGVEDDERVVSVIEDAPVEWEGTNSENAWRALKLRLDGQGKSVSSYRRAIADGALERNPETKLPAWLIDGFLVERSEDLIRIYLHHGLVKQACAFANKVVDHNNHALPMYGDQITPSHNVKWLPYTVLDQLLLALDEAIDEANQNGNDDATELETCRSELAEHIYAYLSKTRDDTVTFAENFTAVNAAPLPKQISRNLEYSEGSVDLVAPIPKSQVAANTARSSILDRLGPAESGTASNNPKNSILERLGPSASSTTTGAGATTSAFGGWNSDNTPKKPISSSTAMSTPPPGNTSLFGGLASNKQSSLFSDLATSKNPFGASSVLPDFSSSGSSAFTGGMLTFGTGPGLSPDGPKPKPEGAKYQKRADRKNAGY
ncbi:hypothetical protein BDR26DRAFT_1007906 [Obelidium mucronatum]|nr:hypothetical protein BDR26DRAFT_1007906 [Obelidium mucronatum]